MNLSFFIYRKLRSTNDKNNISSRIIKIAITSVFLGVFVSLLAISIGKGLQNSIKDKLYSLSPDIVISTYENNSRGVLSEKMKDIQSIHDDIINQFPELEIAYSIEKPLLISNNKSFESLIFKGVSKSFDFQNLNKFILDKKIDNYLSRNNIIVSKRLSDKLDVEVGDNITLYFQTSNSQSVPKLRSFKVSHLFNTDFPEFDENYVIGSTESIQEIFRWHENEYSSIDITVHNKSNISLTENLLSQLNSIKDKNISIKSVQSKYANIFSWVSIFDFNIIIITVLMVLVALISIIITLFTLIFERVKMIGILSSLGFNNWALSKIFIYQGLDILFKGVLPANILFFIITIIQNQFKIIKLNPNDYYVDSIPLIIDITLIIYLNLSFLLITLIFLYFIFTSITKFAPSININS